MDQLFFDEIPELTLKTPLMYYGSKNRGKKILDKCIPNNITEIVSPFAGGCSLELFLTRRKIRVHAYDIFEPLVNFFQEYMKDAPKLIETAKNLFFSKDYDYFVSKKDDYYNLTSNYEKAAHYYVLNKYAFNSIIFKGALPPNKFKIVGNDIYKVSTNTKTNLFPKTAKFYNPYFSFKCKSFEDALQIHKNVFAYLDPPYPEARDSYGDKPEHHKSFNHEKLYEILRDRKKWLLSYNNCETVRKLYRNFKIYNVSWKYSSSKGSRAESNEILICSSDLEKHISKLYL